jgi:hypothetical protein
MTLYSATALPAPLLWPMDNASGLGDTCPVQVWHGNIECRLMDCGIVGRFVFSVTSPSSDLEKFSRGRVLGAGAVCVLLFGRTECVGECTILSARLTARSFASSLPTESVRCRNVASGPADDSKDALGLDSAGQTGHSVGIGECECECDGCQSG